MKRIVSLVLALVMSMQFCAYGFAMEAQDVATTTESLFGYTFTERQLATGEYVIESYYEGQPNKRYTIAEDSPVIQVQYISPKTRQSDYTIAKPNVTKNSMLTRAERWASVGYIYYCDTNTAYPGAVRAYTMAYGNSTTTTCYVDVPERTPFDDVVSFLVSFMLSEGFAKYAALAGFTLAGWMGALLTSMVGAVGVVVIEGIITSALSDEVDVYVTEWDFKSTPSTETDSGDTAYLLNQGSTCLIMYSDNIDWDEVEEGVTLSNCKESTTFARNMWEEMFPSTPYPGVEKWGSK